MTEDLRTPMAEINCTDNQGLPQPADIEIATEAHIQMAEEQKMDDLSDNLSVSVDGSENIVFKQDVPETQGSSAVRNLMNDFSVQISIFMACFLVSGFFFLNIYESKIPNFSPILFSISVVLV